MDGTPWTEDPPLGRLPDSSSEITLHRRANCVLHQMGPSFLKAQESDEVAVVACWMVQTQEKASGAAQPPAFSACDVRAACHVTAPAEDDVAFAHDVPDQSVAILFSDAGDVTRSDLVVAELLRHDDWNTVLYIVAGVQLTSKGAGLDESRAALDECAEGRRQTFRRHVVSLGAIVQPAVHNLSGPPGSSAG